MTFAINDLSKLTMAEEDLVTLLANLLDNAIEACEKLDAENTALRKNIHFKMVLEEGQLILSVRNPVSTPVQIKNNMVVTTKRIPFTMASACQTWRLLLKIWRDKRPSLQ